MFFKHRILRISKYFIAQTVLSSLVIIIYNYGRNLFFAQEQDVNVYNDSSLEIIVEKSVARRFAVISTSIVDENFFYYMFYIPICSLAWRRIGYEPLVLIVRNNASQLTTVSNKTIECLNYFKVAVIFVEAPQAYERQIGMLARLFGGLLPNSIVNEQDFLILCDSDLIPISKETFHFYNTNAISIVNAFGTGALVEHKGKKYDMFPMSYIGMRKWQWREVMQLKKSSILNGDTIMDHVKRILVEARFVKDSDIVHGGDGWFTDQYTVTIAINDYMRSDDAVRRKRKLNKFKFPGLRMDRVEDKSCWYQKLSGKFDQVIDAHMFHADAKAKFEWIYDLLLKLFGKNICNKHLDKYFADFLQTV